MSLKKLSSLEGKYVGSTITGKRKAIKKKSRKPSEFRRIYGSKERVEFVKSLPCAACGVVGYSENAHVAPPREKGTGYKAGYEWIAPLCGNRSRITPGALTITFGCHGTYDKERWRFDAAFPDFNAETAAASTQKLWLEHSGETK